MPRNYLNCNELCLPSGLLFCDPGWANDEPGKCPDQVSDFVWWVGEIGFDTIVAPAS